MLKIMKTFNLFISLCVFSFSICAQDSFVEVHSEDGKPFLIGKVPLEAFEASPYTTWYKDQFTSYQPNNALVQELKEPLRKYKILLFLGTWCGDSKREIPRFIKILEAADFPMEQTKIVALDRRKGFLKKSPTGEEWGLQIKRVPTFILLKDGKEVNRIVESPINSLEADLLRIISSKHYVPNYVELMKSR